MPCVYASGNAKDTLLNLQKLRVYMYIKFDYIIIKLMSSVPAVTVYDFLLYCRPYLWHKQNNLTKKSHEPMPSIEEDKKTITNSVLPIRKDQQCRGGR